MCTKELILEQMFLKFAVLKLRVSRQLGRDVLLANNAKHLKSIQGLAV